MVINMRYDWQIWVKKLALAYETGWEYKPGSEEPGSVLTDIFLEMEEKNDYRLKEIEKKHRQTFLKVVPERKKETKRLKAALSVKAPGVYDGKRLEKGTRVYTMTENGEMLDFRTVSALQLTAADLRWIICRKGLSAWLCYREGDEFPVISEKVQDRELAHPVFRWRFQGICDGHKQFSFVADFGMEADMETVPPGSWTVSDGRNIYPAEWTQSERKLLLVGECPEFAKNLEGEIYELCMKLSAEGSLTEEWLKLFAGNLTLWEEEETLEPELCLTQGGFAGSRRVLPFGREPELTGCFYLACDRAAAGAGGDLTLRFLESFEMEERLPEPKPEALKKQYKKYAWMLREEPVQEWKAEETVWEYFNGSIWQILPGSEDWHTGCLAENESERSLCFTVPSDMRPCVVEGEEHLYLRLRIERVQGAYAAYFRKRIPVFRDICFHAGAHSCQPQESDLPDIGEALDSSIYLGFDKEVTCDNCWYIGKSFQSFIPEQIKGWGVRYGKKAYWVKLPWKEKIEDFLPNCVEIYQDTMEDVQLRIPEKTVYYVESGGLGALDAVSVSEAHYDENGAPIQNEIDAAEHYFQHFCRLLTPMDMKLLLQERYPFLKVKSCVYHNENNELEVVFTMPHQEDQEQKAVELAEIRGWLCSALRRMGGIWLQTADVKCILQTEEGKAGKKNGYKGERKEENGRIESLDDSSYDEIWEKVLEKLDSRAPWWSHRAVSDPGITLLEMWAVLCDMQSFYLDQVQESHYRKYLKLLGIALDEGSCAQTWVSFQGVKKDCTLPVGTRLLADTMVFETEEPTALIANNICGIIKEGNSERVFAMRHRRKNRIRLNKSGVLFYILLEEPLKAGQEFLLHILLNEKLNEKSNEKKERNPMSKDFSLVSLIWECGDGQNWMEAKVLRDDTYGLLRSGCICLKVDSSMAAQGQNDRVRCRVAEGVYDVAPTLYTVSLNVARVWQKKTLCCHEDSEILESCGQMELRSYLAKTGSIRVFEDLGNSQWKDITKECRVDPPITAERMERYVYFRKNEKKEKDEKNEKKIKVRILCFDEKFLEEFGCCPITGITGQQIHIPWSGLLRNSVELMLAQDNAGLYREFHCKEPEETWFDNAWHWQEGENCIVLGDGRHGSIPPASKEGMLFTSLSLFEGRKGNVSIGRINRLEREDLFPQISCSNPLPGRGGRDRKLPSEQFEEAGESLRELSRIVTKEDAEELARRTPGLLIETAEAQWQDQTIVVTVTPKVFIDDANLAQKYRDEIKNHLEKYRPAGSRLKIEIADWNNKGEEVCRHSAYLAEN